MKATAQHFAFLLFNVPMISEWSFFPSMKDIVIPFVNRLPIVRNLYSISPKIKHSAIKHTQIWSMLWFVDDHFGEWLRKTKMFFFFGMLRYASNDTNASNDVCGRDALYASAVIPHFTTAALKIWKITTFNHRYRNAINNKMNGMYLCFFWMFVLETVFLALFFRDFAL